MKTAVQSAERDAVVAIIAGKIAEGIADWQSGRFYCSPSELDYVLAAEEVLSTYVTTFPGSVPEGREFVADVMHERMSAGELGSFEEMAGFLYDELTAE